MPDLFTSPVSLLASANFIAFLFDAAAPLITHSAGQFSQRRPRRLLNDKNAHTVHDEGPTANKRSEDVDDDMPGS